MGWLDRILGRREKRKPVSNVARNPAGTLKVTGSKSSIPEKSDHPLRASGHPRPGGGTKSVAPERPAAEARDLKVARKETPLRKKKAEPKRETAHRLKDDAAYCKRGADRLRRGDLEGAIADCSKAIELNPDCVDAYAQRGVARERKGDVTGARADYTKSIEIEVRTEIARQMAASERLSEDKPRA